MTMRPQTHHRRAAVRLLVAAVAAAAIGAVSTSASAGGPVAGGSPATAHPGASSSRDLIIDDVQTEHTVNDCTGDLGTFTRTFTGFAHITTRPDGSVHFNALVRADDATFVPDDPSRPVFSGTELVHVSETTNGSDATSTFRLRFRAETADGDRASVMEIEHLTISAAGNVVEFGHSVLICP